MVRWNEESIEENFSFFQHLITVKRYIYTRKYTYTRFVFIYFLEYHFYHSPSEYYCYLPAMFYFTSATTNFIFSNSISKSILPVLPLLSLIVIYFDCSPPHVRSISIRIVTAPSITPHFPRLMVRLKRSGGYESRNLTFQSIDAIVSRSSSN